MNYRTERVSYSRTIHRINNGIETWEKSEFSLQPEDDTDPLEIHAEAKRLVLQAQSDEPVQQFERVANEAPMPVKQVEKPEAPHEVTLEDINSCTDAKVLENSYKWLVRGKPTLQEAYRNKLIELQNK